MPTPTSPARLAVASVAILVALVASGALVLDALGLASAPGCGVDGGCGEAADSVFGSLALGSVSWPVSHLGFAYFLAAGAGLVLHRRAISPAFKALVALGTLASVFYTVVILANLDEYICWYCIASHAANFVFAGVVLSTRSSAPAPTPPKTILIMGAAFVLSTGALVGAEAWSASYVQEKASDEADESFNRLVDAQRERDSAANVSSEGADVDGAETTSDAADDQTNADDDPSVDDAGWPVETPFAMDDFPVDACRTDGRGFTGRYRLGPKEATARIVIFSSYGCKFCATLEQEVLEILRTRESVSFSHRHVPLDLDCNPHISRTMHRDSCVAAYLAEAVGEVYGPVGFWRVHKLIFERLRSETPFNFAPDLRSLGFDPDTVNRVLRDRESLERFRAFVREDVDAAHALGLRQTPFVFVNGVEVRGWNARGQLTRFIDRTLSNFEPGTPEDDSPQGAVEKFIDDFFARRARRNDMGADVRTNAFGPEDAPVDVQVWLGFGRDNNETPLRALDALREKYPEALRITIRHYPFGEDCNFFSETMDYPDSCRAHRALEAAGIIGGDDTFVEAYRWLRDNTGDQDDEVFTEGRVPELAAEIGVDADELRATMDAKTVGDALLSDAQFLHKNRLAAVRPIVFINNRRVRTYAYNNDALPILEGILRRELGVER